MIRYTLFSGRTTVRSGGCPCSLKREAEKLVRDGAAECGDIVIHGTVPLKRNRCECVTILTPLPKFDGGVRGWKVWQAGQSA